jgi:hypothetical protein
MDKLEKKVKVYTERKREREGERKKERKRVRERKHYPARYKVAEA